MILGEGAENRSVGGAANTTSQLTQRVVLDTGGGKQRIGQWEVQLTQPVSIRPTKKDSVFAQFFFFFSHFCLFGGKILSIFLKKKVFLQEWKKKSPVRPFFVGRPLYQK